MKKTIFIFCASVLLVKASWCENTGNKIKKVENGLKYSVMFEGQKTMNILQRMKEHNVPNVSISVINNGKIQWEKTYNLNEKEKVNPKTLFQAGSISKAVSAFFMLKYVENGYFKLNEDVNQYLKTWKMPENKITLDQLLSHTAGTNVSGFQGYSSTVNRNELPTLTQILNGENPPANSQKVKVIGIPGAQYAYSGGGYLVAQKMLEDLTQKKYANIAEGFFSKLNMKYSTFQLYYPNEKHPSIAFPHEANGAPEVGGWLIYPESFAAGLWSNPTDLSKFVVAVQKSDEGKSNKILSQKMTQMMLTKQPNSPYGLGFEVKKYADGITEFKHMGATVGFISYLVGFTKNGQGAVIMTNSNGGVLLYPEIIRSIADAYSWHKGYTYEYKNAQAIKIIDPVVLHKIVGRYNLRIDSINPPRLVQIVTDNKEIYYTEDGIKKYKLIPISKTDFFNEDRDFVVHFNDENYTQFSTGEGSLKSIGIKM